MDLLRKLEPGFNTTKLNTKIDNETDSENIKISGLKLKQNQSESFSNISLDLDLENFIPKKHGLSISNEILAMNDSSSPGLFEKYPLESQTISYDQNFTTNSSESDFFLNKKTVFLDAKNEKEFEESKNSNSTYIDSFRDFKKEFEQPKIKRELGTKNFKLKLAPGMQALGHFPFQLNNKNHLTFPIPNEASYNINNFNEPFTITESHSKSNIKFENGCMVSITVTTITTRTYSQISDNQECMINDLQKKNGGIFNDIY